jgi:hypothetical protein
MTYKDDAVVIVGHSFLSSYISPYTVNIKLIYKNSHTKRHPSIIMMLIIKDIPSFTILLIYSIKDQHI